MSDPWTATLRVVDALDAAGIPAAIGGSLAMAAFGYVRATYDGDVNIFVPMEAARPALEALAAAGLEVDVDAGVARAASRGDGLLHVDGVRVDLFFDSIPLHASAAGRVVTLAYQGRAVRVLGPEDLVVLKALFNRAKDWVDIERIVTVLGERFDRAYCREQLVAHAGADDASVSTLERIFARG